MNAITRIEDRAVSTLSNKLNDLDDMARDLAGLQHSADTLSDTLAILGPTQAGFNAADLAIHHIGEAAYHMRHAVFGTTALSREAGCRIDAAHVLAALEPQHVAALEWLKVDGERDADAYSGRARDLECLLAVRIDDDVFIKLGRNRRVSFGRFPSEMWSLTKWGRAVKGLMLAKAGVA